MGREGRCEEGEWGGMEGVRRESGEGGEGWREGGEGEV